MGLFRFIKSIGDNLGEAYEAENAATEEELIEAGAEDGDYEECPECEGPMKYEYGDWWRCVRCGKEFQQDDYGNFVTDVDDYDEEDAEDNDEGISVYEAAEIWASQGKDEDYMFGYSEEELENAL